jgi:hypothetical protein
MTPMPVVGTHEAGLWDQVYYDLRAERDLLRTTLAELVAALSDDDMRILRQALAEARKVLTP